MTKDKENTVTEYGDPNQYVRQLLSGLTTGIPPDGPYDAADLEIVHEDNLDEPGRGSFGSFSPPTWFRAGPGSYP